MKAYPYSVRVNRSWTKSSGYYYTLNLVGLVVPTNLPNSKRVVQIIEEQYNSLHRDDFCNYGFGEYEVPFDKYSDASKILGFKLSYESLTNDQVQTLRYNG